MFKKLLIGGVLLLMLMAAFATVPQAKAYAASGVHTRHATKSIDWSHPELLPVTRSGIGFGIGTRYIRPNQVTPFANFPWGQCYNNTAYKISYGGTNHWDYTEPAPYNTFTLRVEYYWCPRWNGDSAGLNFGKGQAFDNIGCHSFNIGNVYNNDNVGADMRTNSSYLNVGDGENSTTYNICAGNSIYDFSLTADGTKQYSSFMGVAYDTAALVFVQESPTF